MKTRPVDILDGSILGWVFVFAFSRWLSSTVAPSRRSQLHGVVNGIVHALLALDWMLLGGSDSESQRVVAMSSAYHAEDLLFFFVGTNYGTVTEFVNHVITLATLSTATLSGGGGLGPTTPTVVVALLLLSVGDAGHFAIVVARSRAADKRTVTVLKRLHLVVFVAVKGVAALWLFQGALFSLTPKNNAQLSATTLVFALLNIQLLYLAGAIRGVM